MKKVDIIVISIIFNRQHLMKTFVALTLTLSAATLSAIAEPTSAASGLAFDTHKTIHTQLSSANQKELTYEELFDLGERFVDKVVYSRMDEDPTMIEYLFDINVVRVSSDGQFATVRWHYDYIVGGVVLLEQQGDGIVILAERSEALPLYSLEVMGVPPAAAAEIAIY